jgi:hypothetical protein
MDMIAAIRDGLKISEYSALRLDHMEGQVHPARTGLRHNRCSDMGLNSPLLAFSRTSVTIRNVHPG